jgi:hypothetical protein
LDVQFCFSGNESSTGFYLYGFLLTALIAFNPWLILLLAGYYSLIFANLISTVRITHFQEVKPRKKRTGLPALFGS